MDKEYIVTPSIDGFDKDEIDELIKKNGVKAMQKMSPFFQLPKELVSRVGPVVASVMAKLIDKHNHVISMTKEQIAGSLSADGDRATNAVLDGGYFFCLQHEIARELNITEKMVRTALKKLIEMDFIEKFRGGNRAKNFYRIKPLNLVLFYGKDEEMFVEMVLQLCDIIKKCPHDRSGSGSEVGRERSTVIDIIEKNSSSLPSLLRKEEIELELDPALRAASNQSISFRKSIKKPIENSLENKTTALREKMKNTRTAVKFDYKLLQSIIDLWNSLGLKKIKNEVDKRKCFRILKDLMSGTFFADKSEFTSGKHDRSYTDGEITTAIRNFALCATNHNYFPNDIKTKKKMLNLSFELWTYNRFKKSNGKNDKYKSLFLFSLNNEPKESYVTYDDVESHAPNATKIIKEMYVKRILGGIEPKQGFTDYENHKFILAGNKLRDFWERNNDKMVNWSLRLTLFEKVRILFESVLQSVGEQHKYVTPNVIASDKTFDERLPKYLCEQRLTKDENDWEDDKDQWDYRKASYDKTKSEETHQTMKDYVEERREEAEEIERPNKTLMDLIKEGKMQSGYAELLAC